MSVQAQNHAILEYLSARRQGIIKHGRDPGLARVVAATRTPIRKVGFVEEGRDIAESILAEVEGSLIAAGINPSLSPRDLDAAIESATTDMDAVLRKQVHDYIRQAYQEGVRQASLDVGAQVAFGGRHEDAIRAITESKALTDAYKGFSEASADTIHGAIRAAFDEGQVSPGNLTAELTQALGEELWGRLQTIARTETHVAYEYGKENKYRDVMDERGEEFLFRYAGPQDSKTSLQCQEIHRRIKDMGGATLDEMNDIIADVSQDPKHGGRPDWDPYLGRPNALSHPNCRHARIRWMNAPAGKQGVKKARLAKEWNHAKTMADVPTGAPTREGPRGGIYYWSDTGEGDDPESGYTAEIAARNSWIAERMKAERENPSPAWNEFQAVPAGKRIAYAGYGTSPHLEDIEGYVHDGPPPTMEPDEYIIGEVAYQQKEVWERVAKEADTTVMDYQMDAMLALQEIVDASPIKMRVRAEDLASIVADGRFKSLHETGFTGGANDTHTRRQSEKDYWGYQDDSPTASRPVFAYVDAGEPSDALAQYGNVDITFKDSVKDRATVTVGDSRHTYMSKGAVPTPARSVDHQAIDIDNFALYGKIRHDLKHVGKLGSVGYIEAQLHQGVSMGDIDHVTMPSKYRDQDSPMGMIGMLLADAGVDVRWEEE